MSTTPADRTWLEVALYVGVGLLVGFLTFGIVQAVFGQSVWERGYSGTRPVTPGRPRQRVNWLAPSTIQIVAHYRYDGRWALPDSLVTPGAIETSDTAVVCHRTTATLRHVSLAMHHAIFATYGIPWARHAKYEDDHVISLELGGRNDNTNRFPQPYPQAYSKDSVENWARRQACSGKLSLPYIQRQMVSDWVVLYRQMKVTP